MRNPAHRAEARRFPAVYNLAIKSLQAKSQVFLMKEMRETLVERAEMITFRVINFLYAKNFREFAMYRTNEEAEKAFAVIVKNDANEALIDQKVADHFVALLSDKNKLLPPSDK